MQRVSTYLGLQISQQCFVVSWSVLLVRINCAKSWAWLWHFHVGTFCTLNTHTSSSYFPFPLPQSSCSSLAVPFLLWCLLSRWHTWEQACFAHLSEPEIISLNTITSSSIHFPADDMNWFSFMAEWYFIMCVSYLSLPVHPLMHLGRCHNLAVMESTV